MTHARLDERQDYTLTEETTPVLVLWLRWSFQ